ncbi:39S ribosomal protein L47, mitochondrial [Belonocnema kinseyi]|uniref:39S ribosomal protein L47, mitochondrial n=1 Tax=Belonocnema kinseyi TaxID=2817044 RepID=UPI00143DD2DE|nr:39S ribosomal protein L47, mitochondrial [Belonocnema kinseyi]
MAALTKVIHATRKANNIIKLLTNFSIKCEVTSFAVPTFNSTSLARHAFIHTTPVRNGLMEFFDDEKNWGKRIIKVGREWYKDELRIKSNEDLHKLWYVLLKERNMLLTMEASAKRRYELFPNPERIDKVEISMENLEAVVRERNKAYHLLETGETGERPAKVVRNAIGLPFCYRLRQHVIPKFANKKWKETHVHRFGGQAVRKFLRLYREKYHNIRRKEKNRQANEVLKLMRNFPDLDEEALKEKFPDVDLEKVKRNRKCRGHFVASE